MKDLEKGYYWVKPKDSKVPQIMIFEPHGKLFFGCANNNSYIVDDIKVLEGPIKEPKEKECCGIMVGQDCSPDPEFGCMYHPDYPKKK